MIMRYIGGYAALTIAACGLSSNSIAGSMPCLGQAAQRPATTTGQSKSFSFHDVAECLSSMRLAAKDKGSEQCRLKESFSFHEFMEWIGKNSQNQDNDQKRRPQDENQRPEGAWLSSKNEPLSDMVGQMIVVGFRGSSIRHAGVKAVVQQLRDGLIGGVILHGPNIKSPEQVRKMTDHFYRAAKRLVPMIQVDQEGGKVQRLTRRNGHRSAEAPSAAKVSSRLSPQDALALYSKMARTIAHSGININLAPVIDLNVNPRNPDIGRHRRSFSADPERVGSYAKMFVRAHKANNVVTVAKHFPGQGSMRTDPHVGLADISKTWSKNELTPYRALFAGKDRVRMVLVGHVYHPLFSDAQGIPASLSSRAITGFLRGELGFDGVVSTDDLEMGGIKKNFGVADSIVRAVNAGNDILLFSNSKLEPRLGEKIHAIVMTGIATGKIRPMRIRESFCRIAALKRAMIENRRPIAPVKQSFPSKQEKITTNPQSKVR
jgi:beta-N-acetylhexosaminidase